MPSTRTCTKCETEKPLTEFGPRRGGKEGRRTHCRGCIAAAQRKRYDAKPIGEPQLTTIKALAAYGTEVERAVIEAMIETGSVAAAAAKMQLTPSALRGHLQELERRAARSGWAPGSDMTKPVPTGYHVKGVSTLYGADGEVRGQWVKSAANRESELEQLAAAVATICEPIRGGMDPVPAPKHTAKDLLNVIPIGDPHFGMFAWERETGNNFDLKIAEDNLCGAFEKLMALAPPADQCLVVPLGDFFHADNSSNQTTRSHHALDVDGRWSKVLQVGIRAMRHCIDLALKKHKRVHGIIEIGNHDDHSAQMLALVLASLYEREPRVEIDTSPSKYHWFRFGKVLIGTTHGDTVKHDKLGGIMAHDRAKDWGETTHRYWLVGHVHHDSAKEQPGVLIETFRTLAARDAWHHAAGYRSARDLKLDVYHREHGRINRHIIGVDQLRGGVS